MLEQVTNIKPNKKIQNISIPVTSGSRFLRIIFKQIVANCKKKPTFKFISHYCGNSLIWWRCLINQAMTNLQNAYKTSIQLIQCSRSLNNNHFYNNVYIRKNFLLSFFFFFFFNSAGLQGDTVLDTYTPGSGLKPSYSMNSFSPFFWQTVIVRRSLQSIKIQI